MSFSLSMPVGSLRCLPDTDRQALMEGLQQGRGLCKRQLQSHPCTFGSKLQSEGTGKTVALLFLLLSSPHGSPDGLAPEDTEIRLGNCFCSLT